MNRRLSASPAALVALALCLLLAAAPAARGATVCRLVSGGGLAFGSYDVLSPTPNDTLLGVTVACDRDGGPQHTTVTMSIGPGSNGAAVTARRMAHGGGSGDLLAYGLFRDVSRSSAWGFSPGIDAVSQTIAVPNKGSASMTFTIYGRIPAQQDVSAGSYGDTVQVTLTP